MMTFPARLAGPALALIAALAAPPARAAELTLLRTLPFAGPSGLAYDSRFCGLWVASERREVVLITLHGEELRRFDSELGRVDAVATVADGLLLGDGGGGFQHVDLDGAPLGRPFRAAGALRDTDGLFVDPATGAVWVSDDSAAVLARISDDDAPEIAIDGMALSPPLAEPQGITIDPVSGHVLVVDDADGRDALFEFTAAGTLRAVIPLAGGGIADAEAVTVQPETGTVFIGFDDTDTIGVYAYRPSPPRDAASPARERAAPSACVVSALAPGIQAG